jgi:hypothetical protein
VKLAQFCRGRTYGDDVVLDFVVLNFVLVWSWATVGIFERLGTFHGTRVGAEESEEESEEPEEELEESKESTSDSLDEDESDEELEDVSSLRFLLWDLERELDVCNREGVDDRFSFLCASSGSLDTDTSA